MDGGTKQEPREQTIGQRLEALFQECVTRPRGFSDPTRINREARYCYWPGKTLDGRRWSPALGDSEVFPWPGSSDISVPLIDGYVNEDVALAVQAIASGNVTVTGHNTTDVAFGTRATNALKWMLEDEMEELSREKRLLANYHFERGHAVVLIQWERQVQMGYQELTLAMVQKMADAAIQQLQADAQMKMQMGQRVSGPKPGNGSNANNGSNGPAPLTDDQVQKLMELANLPSMVADPTAEDRLVELVIQFADQLVSQNFQRDLGEYEDELLEDYKLGKPTARRVVRELREEGKTEFPIPTVRRNRPVIMSLALGEDCFVPDDATDFELNRCFFWIEWISEESLRERVVSRGWDKDWVEYVAKHGKGQGSTPGTGAPDGAASASFTGAGAQNHGRTLLDTRNLYAIRHCYERKINEDDVPGIYYTVINPCIVTPKNGDAVKQEYAIHELLTYAHGNYPAVLFRREFLSRRLDDSRGYGEIGTAWQRQLKTEADMQVNRSTLATNPPLHHPKGRPPTKWGPGCKVPANKSEYFYADIPQHDPSSNEVWNRVLALADWYFGRATEGRDPVLAKLLQTEKVSVWLDGWKLVYTQVFQLMQQFLPDEFYYRVVGSSQGQSLHARRDEIQGKFSVSVKFDPSKLDPEVLMAKIKAITTLIQTLDINGITDHNKLLAELLTWIDPDIAQSSLKPADAATQHEIEDEQTIFARMWAGVGTDVKPGQAYALRLQVLQDAIGGKDPQTGEPKNPQALQRMQSDPVFAKLVQNRVQQLQMQVEQRQNAVIGRLGAAPQAPAAQ